MSDTKPPSPSSRFRQRILWLALSIGALVYLSGPVIASVYEIGDRRGPRIYPVWLHETIYMMVWDMTPHEAKKPRLPYHPTPRPWFYDFDSAKP